MFFHLNYPPRTELAWLCFLKLAVFKQTLSVYDKSNHFRADAAL